MDLTALHAIAEKNEWMAIFPEILVACLALLLLVLDLLFPPKHHGYIAGIALFGMLAILPSQILSFKVGYIEGETFNGLLRHSFEGQLMRVFFLSSAALVCLLGMITLPRQRVPRTEFYHTVLVVTAAMMLLAQSNHFVMLFVALETLTIGLYILVSYFRSSPLSLEAGLKYLIMGALSSSILLFGIVLLYGVAGNPMLPSHSANAMGFDELSAFLAANPHNFLASVGIVLVLSGVAFKIGAFPFQIWVPDVYQGAPTPITAFLAVASKAAGFVILLILARTFSAYAWLTLPILTLMAGATMLFGNLAALTQHNVKRLIGLSGVSHAGFLLLGVVAAASTPLGYGAIYFYLFAYLLASFAVFGVMAHVAGPDDADQDLSHYAGLAKERPFLALVLAIGLGSLAGIPPLAGFMGKLFIFIAAFKAGSYGLLAIAVVSVVISIYYYFGWIRAAFFETWTLPAGAQSATPSRTPVTVLAGVALGVLAAGTVILGFYQGPLGQWLSER
ncbi:MAG: proton-translocating NADH-quinone oxidoreductase, chain [Verrucomicrobia bacterium]|nr:proton-translocating NADH-quinone oxidoreductase, chain [Verrucomicrobiota bacterium]